MAMTGGAHSGAGAPYRPGERVDLDGLRRALSGLEVIDDDAARERAGRDFYWYSPVLKRHLDGHRPDLVVRPHSLEQVRTAAAACAKARVPLTVRGGGTGNYGQCVPLFGGVSLDMTAMNRVLEINHGRARVEAGVLLHDVDQAARAQGLQLRMWPSTARIATVGGFIAGGHSGIGSMRHGILADPGNVLSMQIVTLEAVPRVLTLRGDEIKLAHHAYGSNGIITEIELALTPAVEWQHTIALFDTYAAVLDFGLAAGAAAVQDAAPDFAALDLFQLSAVERRITPYYSGLRAALEDRDAMFAQVAPASLAAYEQLVKAHGGRLAVSGTEAELLARGLPSCTECAYNHTTLEALKSDPGVTYLQVAYPGPLDAKLVARQMERFGDEVLMHHEFSRSGGELVSFALPLVIYFDEAQLRGLIASFEADGCLIFDPHTWVLEDGGMKHVDEAQLDFKRKADPLGLMNPGKVRAWDERVLGIPGGGL